MRCLAVNSATMALSVALVEDARVLYHFATTETRDQGNLLLEHIRKGLTQSGIGYDDLDLLAVVTGPGSFTGIRIGLAALRGISLAAGIPVMGVPSFDMFRSADSTEDYEAVAVESWREELYFSAFDKSGREAIPPVNETAEDFARRLSALKGSLRISGDAREKLAGFCPSAQVAVDIPDARRVAELALTRLKAGAAFSKPEPFYLREADVTLPAAAK